MDWQIEGDVLLVGEGDFSFTKALLQHTSGNRLTSTSLESQQTIQKHQHALQNVDCLQKSGVDILFEVDACQLYSYARLRQRLFQRIIFNFPHVGGKSNHKKNRKLLNDFFCSAVSVLQPKGEILMTLCKGQGGTPADRPQRKWQDSWQVVSMAANAGLVLSDVRPFHAANFTEYSCVGFRSQDKWFHTEGAITHIFTKATPVNIPQYLPASDASPTHRYTSKKLKRSLLDNPYHPLCILKEQFENVFQALFKAIVIPIESLPPLRTDELNWQQDSLLNHVPAILGDQSDESVDLRMLSGPVYKTCPIQFGSFPVQHEMAGVHRMDTADITELAFLNQLESVLGQEFKNTENNVNICMDKESDLPQEENASSCAPHKFIQICRIALSEVHRCTEIGRIYMYHDNPECEQTEAVLGASAIVFVLSLDKLLCQLCGIDDPRLIWSEDDRFLKPFFNKCVIQISQFKPFSLYPKTFNHDISFWENRDRLFSDDEFWDIIREVTGDCVREVTLQDKYTDPVTQKVSRCYRLTFQSCDQALSYNTSWKLQSILRLQVADIMGITLR